jgi:uncharacterized protein YegP (UPF0339 family)
VQSDHGYGVVVHPTLRAQVRYDRDDGNLSELTLRLAYRRDGEWDDDSEWPEEDSEWHEPDETATALDVRGRRVTVTRDGDPLLDRDLSVLASPLLDRYGRTVADAARRASQRVRGLGERAPDTSERDSVATEESAEPASWPVSVTQADGTTVEALRPPAQANFEVFEDTAGEWRWRLRHRNGNIIADSGEGYSSKRAAKGGIESVKRNALGSPVEEQ